MSNEPAESTPSLQAQLQPSSVKLGDVLTLQIQSTHAPGVLLKPAPLPRELGTFEVFASTALPPVTAGSMETQQFQIALQNFTTGQQILPGLTFTYQGADHQPQVLKTPEFKVTVEMLPPGPKDKGDIRGIKGVIGPFGISPWWWMLLVFALVIGGVAWWSHRRRVEQGPPPVPPDPADKTALTKLQDLLTSGWIENGKIKEFYIAISDITRAYIEDGFACPALERTTGELMRDLRARSVYPSDKLILLKSLLEECDLVKFAKFRPEAAESLKAHSGAVQFVEGTKNLLDPGFRRSDGPKG